jgi:hypothetical protein
MSKWTPKTIVAAVLLSLLLGFGLVDFWSGNSDTYDGVITDKYTRASGGGDSPVRNHYYLIVSSDANMGMPVEVSVWQHKFWKYNSGDKCRVEVATGGITGFTYYARIR